MDIAKYKKVVLAIRPALLNIANRITRNSEDAEDVVQDVCLKLWHKCIVDGDPDNVEAYCTAMTKNMSIDKIRGRKPQHDLEEYSHTKTLEHLPDELLEIKEEQALIHYIISLLPSLQRQILQLKDIEGYDTDEIVEITGITAESVRNNLSRARKRLRELFLEGQLKSTKTMFNTLERENK